MTAPRRARRRFSLPTTIALAAFLLALVSTLVVYDHVVIEDGPEVLSGRPIGAPCDDSEQCRAPLGSATRAAVSKVCATTEGGGRCALTCSSSEDCPAGSRCVEGRYREAETTLPGRLCQPTGQRGDR